MLTKNQIKLYRSLQQKKYRDQEECFIVEGPKIVQEAISSVGNNIKEIICTADMLDIVPESNQNKAIVTSVENLKKISSLSTPPNILAVINKETPTDIEIDESDIVLALDHISDPGNLGTIIRLADWFGIQKIICSPNTVDCYNPKTIQATMGSIFRVQIKYQELSKYITDCNNKNITSYGTFLDGDSIYSAELATPCVLVMGNESNGISEEIEKVIEKKLLIPNFSKNSATSESLNVATATAIALSELRRRI